MIHEMNELFHDPNEILIVHWMNGINTDSNETALTIHWVNELIQMFQDPNEIIIVYYSLNEGN